MKCFKCEEEVNSYYIRRYGMCVDCLDKLKEAEE